MGSTMIQQRNRGAARMVGGTLCALLLLGACSEKETYLPGKRENVRSILQDPDLAAPLPGEERTQNTSRAIALGGQSNNANWAQSIGTQKYRTSHPALRASLQPVWSVNIGQGDSRKQRITADPVVADGRIFTLDANALVTATSTSGQTIWTRDLTPVTDSAGQGTGGGLAVDGGTLYVSIGYGVLAALDVATGAERWTQQLEASGSGTPTIYGDLVYVTSGDDTGWAIDKNTGRVEWQIGASASQNNVLGAPAPAVTDQFAIFAFGSGEVQGAFRRGGLPRWNASVVGKRPGRALSAVSDVTAGPVVSGDTLYVGNQSGRLAALNVESGQRLWTAREGAVGLVWPIGGSVFAVTDVNELVRIDASDGSRIWGVPLPNFVKQRPLRQSRIVAHYGPVVAGGRVIIASGDGVLRSFDPTDGSLIGTVEIAGGATTSPVVARGTLYVVSSKGQLHAYR